MSEHVLHRWLTKHEKEIGRHLLILMSEADEVRSIILDDLRALVSSHYISPEMTARRLASLGAPKTAQILQERLPVRKKARSGDLGEILATEFAEQHLQFNVPVRRLRWKDGRNMALRGDDIIGLARDKNNRLVFLKGESKSRAKLSTSVLEDVNKALESNRGRPNRHSVLFIADRLREQKEDGLAEELEEAVLQSFKEMRVEHLLFALTGSNPAALITKQIETNLNKKRRRYGVGVHIKDLGNFIEELYGGF